MDPATPGPFGTIDPATRRAELVELRALLERDAPGYVASRRAVAPVPGLPPAVAQVWDVLGWSDAFALDAPDTADLDASLAALFGPAHAMRAALPARARAIETGDEWLCFTDETHASDDPPVYRLEGPRTDAPGAIERVADGCARFVLDAMLARTHHDPVHGALGTASTAGLTAALPNLLPGAARHGDAWLLPVGGEPTLFELWAPSARAAVALLEALSVERFTLWGVVAQGRRRTRRNIVPTAWRRVGLAGAPWSAVAFGVLDGVALWATLPASQRSDDAIELHFDHADGAAIEQRLASGARGG